MNPYFRRWEKEGETWKMIFERLKPVLQELLDSWNPTGKLTWGDHGDSPLVELRWYGDDHVTRSITILIEGKPNEYVLNFSGSAWFDNLFTNMRRAKGMENIYRMPIPENLDELNLEHIKSVLLVVHHILSGWKLGSLRSRSTLPPRPPGVHYNS